MSDADFAIGGILLGIIIVIAVLVRQIAQRKHQSALTQPEEALPPQTQVATPPTSDSLDPPLEILISGHMQDSFAKWESEIQLLGQQIIGQIDSKMTALQAATSEANRTANRLEVLVEHLEQISQRQVERQQHQAAQETVVESVTESVSEEPPVEISTFLPIPDATPLSDVLKELAKDINGIRNTIFHSTLFSEPTDPETLPILHEEMPAPSVDDAPLNIRCEVEKLGNYGVQPKDIARQLDISQEEVNLILQVGELIGTIPAISKSQPSPFSFDFPPMSDYDFDNFDNFVEADETQPAATTKTITDTFKTPPAFKIGIVGVGQCGNNLAVAFHRIGYRRVLLLNTAQTDLDSIEDQIAKLPIDKQGAGKDPLVGKQRVESSATQIRNGMLREFGEDFDKIVVCLGLGGGTGSGGGPVVIDIAKEIIRARGGDPEKDVIVITTLPDPNVDGPRQCFNALNAYGQLTHLGVPMTIIDNAQVGSIIRAKLAEGWTPINMWIARTFHMFNSYANKPSDHGAFDGNDFNDIIRRGRLLFSAFRVTQLKDKYAIADVMAANLERSLFAKCNARTAVAAGCLMVINPKVGKDLRMEDIAPALQELNNIMQLKSTLHRGIYIPSDWSSQEIEQRPDLFCYVILGGLDHPLPTLNGLFEKARHYDQSIESVETFLSAGAAK